MAFNREIVFCDKLQILAAAQEKLAPPIPVPGWAMSFFSGVLDAPVDRPHVLERRAMGADGLTGRHSRFDAMSMAENHLASPRHLGADQQYLNATSVSRIGRK